MSYLLQFFKKATEQKVIFKFSGKNWSHRVIFIIPSIMRHKNVSWLENVFKSHHFLTDVKGTSKIY